MASFQQSNVLTFKCGGVIAKGSVVKPGADADHVVVSAAATSKNLGIAMNTTTTAEDLVEVAFPGGGAKAKLGSGGCAIGDLLTSDASGTLVVTTTPGDRYVAMALADGAENDLVSVVMVTGLI